MNNNNHLLQLLKFGYHVVHFQVNGTPLTWYTGAQQASKSWFEASATCDRHKANSNTQQTQEAQGKHPGRRTRRGGEL
jgi:hypothetical protein